MEEKDPEPELLSLALKDVIEARIKLNNLSEKAKLNWEKLDKILLESGGSEIASLVELLNTLGFRLAVTADRELKVTGTPSMEEIKML